MAIRVDQDDQFYVERVPSDDDIKAAKRFNRGGVVSNNVEFADVVRLYQLGLAKYVIQGDLNG
jgi:hypothetical protein